MNRTSRALISVAVGATLAAASFAAVAADPGRTTTNRSFPTGSVIFFHPDGAGANHWGAARLYFHGPDGLLNWDQLPNLALYRGHMANSIVGSSNGGATTHAFGYRVDALGSFGRDGDGAAARAIRSLSGFDGSILREAANQGVPVGIVNDGHVGEPGTGAFLAEVGNRNNWQEITRQIIQGRPGLEATDQEPWVIFGGGEADVRPQGTTLVHRNHNGERGSAGASNPLSSLRTDALDLEADWQDNVDGDTSNAIGTDPSIVIKTRAQFEELRAALRANPNYAPRVLGLFAYQDLFNDRPEEVLITDGKVTGDPVNFVGPNGEAVPTPGFRPKSGRIVLFGDVAGQPGHNPPTFAEMTEVAIEILDRAAKQQAQAQRLRGPARFMLVAEPESVDNFGNNDNAMGTLQALGDADRAIGKARAYLARNPRTLILTAADSDGGGLQVAGPTANTIVTGAQSPRIVNGNFMFGFGVNPTGTPPAVVNVPDGVEGRGTPDSPATSTAMFVAEPDADGNRLAFAITWPGTGDYSGGIVSRAAGLNAGLLNSVFSARFDNIDVYRLMHATMFGRLPNYPANPGDAPSR